MTRGKGVERFYVHTVTVETFLGETGYGVDSFAAPVTVPGFLDGARKLVRASTGEQVVSEATFYTYPTKAALFVADSKVTTADGVARVIKTNTNTSGTLNLPDHVAVALT